MRQLLTSFSWCLSVEERRQGGLAGPSGVVNLESLFGFEEESGDEGAAVSGIAP